MVHINTSLKPLAYWRDTSYLFVARLLRVRVVYQVHGGSLQEFCRRRALFTRFLKWTLSLPDVVVVLAEVEMNAYRRLIPDQEVVLVANGIDPWPFEEVPVARSSERDRCAWSTSDESRARRGSTRCCRARAWRWRRASTPDW